MIKINDILKNEYIDYNVILTGYVGADEIEATYEAHYKFNSVNVDKIKKTIILNILEDVK